MKARLWCPRCHRRVAPSFVLGRMFAMCTNRTCVFPMLEAGSRALQALIAGRCPPMPKSEHTFVPVPVPEAVQP